MIYVNLRSVPNDSRSLERLESGFVGRNDGVIDDITSDFHPTV